MARFSKLIPFIQNLHFPAQGEVLNPREISPDVALVHEMFRADVKFALKLRTVTSGVLVPIVGSNLLEILIAVPPGFVFLPYLTTFFESADALIRVNLEIESTLPAGFVLNQSPIQLWTPAGIVCTQFVDASFHVPFPCLPYITSLNPGFRWTSVGGGTAEARIIGVEVPLETFDWSRWPPFHGPGSRQGT